MKNDRELLNSLSMLLAGSSYKITLLANMSAFLFYNLNEMNWIGFYIVRKDKLYLGPFQGKPACSEIPFTKGVCGACATQKKTILVSNVHDFPTHIACDADSKSEICIPVFIKNELYALLDVDSPILNRFQVEEKNFLEEAVRILSKHLEEIPLLGI